MSRSTISWANIGLVAVIAMVQAAAQAGAIYWTDPDGPSGSHTIKRANADGSGIQTVVSGLRDPRGMALDLLGRKMYWSEAGLLGVRRANLDGTGPIETVAPGQNGISINDMAVDVSAGKLYWTSSQDPVAAGGGRIQRANLDGSGVENVVTVNLTHPAAIALDLQQGKIYWTDLEGNWDGKGKIQRSNLDGSNVETLVTGIDESNGLAVDPVGGKLYWPELTTKKIQRANLDGSGIEDLVLGLDTPTTIGVDLLEGRMYWTDSGFGGQVQRIERANLDGSEREVIVSGLGFPWGIAVDPEAAISYTLTIGMINAWGSPYVNLEPYSPNNIYPWGTEVTLNAVPAPGKGFDHWEIMDPNYPDDGNHVTVDANNPITVVMYSDLTVNAVFRCSAGLGPMLPLMAVGLICLVAAKRRR